MAGGKLIQMIPIDRSEQVKHKVMIFFPHPDDDVISMGGTFLN
jgi:glucosamine-6-phosphate deaminase